MTGNQYNNKRATVETIDAGTKLYRIYSADATYAANSFNRSPRALGDSRQGRFEPTDPSLGGYLYVSPTLASAVAEGILRNVDIPPSGLVQRAWLTKKRLAELELLEDVTVASLYGPHAARLNLDSGVLCCEWKRYSETRVLGTTVLQKTAKAKGIRYRCRVNNDETSLILVDRGKTLRVDVSHEWEILANPAGFSMICDTLKQVYGLTYTGKGP